MPAFYRAYRAYLADAAAAMRHLISPWSRTPDPRFAALTTALQELRAGVAPLPASFEEVRVRLAALEEQVAGDRQRLAEAASKIASLDERVRTVAGASPAWLSPARRARIVEALRRSVDALDPDLGAERRDPEA